MKFVFIIILSFVCASIARADDERIWVDAKINGKAIRLVLDTATTLSISLFSNSALKLGLNFSHSKHFLTDGNVSVSLSESCNVEVDNSSFGVIDPILNFSNRLSVPVVEIPSQEELPGDGAIGWNAIKNKVFSIDAVAYKISLGAEGLLKGARWETFQLETNLHVLALDIPLGKGINGIIIFDTGSPFGVSLNHQKWMKWKTAHADQPSTFANYYTPSSGENSMSEFWADKLSLGSLTLTDVPVMKEDSSEKFLKLPPRTLYLASFGLAALKRLDIIVDGIDGYVFVRPKNTPPLPYQHNRLGAYFWSPDRNLAQLVAHVVKGSPAYEAGIRDGDILLSVNKSDVAKQLEVAILSYFSVTESDSPSDVAEYPAGTKLEFTLKRGHKLFQTTAILQNILPPDPPNNSN